MMVRDNKVTDSLAHVPTRLSGCGGLTEGRLINWGYALADVALRTRAGLAFAPSRSLPVPDVALS